MRGGKITLHKGSKHGLGGKKFQKGPTLGAMLASSYDIKLNSNNNLVNDPEPN